MSLPDRRRFLTSAVLGGSAVAGATALGSLAPEAAFASAPRLDLEPGARDPNFAEGRITAVSGSLLKVSGSERTLHRIHVVDGTSIWKLRPTTFDQIKVGDGLYARGVRMPDGSLAADAVWVNIVNLYVTVRGIERTRLHLSHGRNALVGNIVDKRTTASVRGGALTSNLSQLKIGHHAQVLGAWRPADDSVDIARISVGH